MTHGQRYSPTPSRAVRHSDFKFLGPSISSSRPLCLHSRSDYSLSPTFLKMTEANRPDKLDPGAIPAVAVPSPVPSPTASSITLPLSASPPAPTSNGAVRTTCAAPTNGTTPANGSNSAAQANAQVNGVALNDVQGLVNSGVSSGLASVDSLLILSKFDELISEIRGLRDEIKEFKGQQAAASAASAAAEAAKDAGVRKVCCGPVRF